MMKMLQSSWFKTLLLYSLVDCDSPQTKKQLCKPTVTTGRKTCRLFEDKTRSMIPSPLSVTLKHFSVATRVFSSHRSFTGMWVNHLAMAVLWIYEHLELHSIRVDTEGDAACSCTSWEPVKCDWFCEICSDHSSERERWDWIWLGFDWPLIHLWNTSNRSRQGKKRLVS